MKVLVLSDSHSSLRFMRQCIEKLKPDAVIHLGDHYDDGQVLAEENPGLMVYQVPGNCDRYRCPFGAPEVISCSVGGVDMYMTHGHNHRVKSGIGALVSDARRAGAKIALYGHTHIPDCRQEPDGLWIFNPGACGGHGGSAGMIQIQNKTITACYFVTQADLEEMQ